MKLRSLVVCLAFAIQACSAVPAPEERATGSRGAVNGGVSSPTCYPAVGYFVGPGSQYCTGTLIAPDLVLTAAHCVEDIDRDGLLAGNKFGIGRFNSSPPVDIAEVFVHPVRRTCGHGTVAGNDVAVVRLATPITGVNFATIASPTRTESTNIAYGTNDGHRYALNSRRQLHFRVESIAADGKITTTGLDGESCAGDSGSPLLQGGAACNQAPTVAGVLSGANDCTRYGGNSIFASVGGPGTAAFIQSVIDGTATHAAAECCPGTGEACFAPGVDCHGMMGCGICAGAVHWCQPDGTYGECSGAVGPEPEICGDGIDQDCDGADAPCCDGSSDPCCGVTCEDGTTCRDGVCGCDGSSDPCCGVDCGTDQTCRDGSCVAQECDPSTDACCGSSDPCCGVMCWDGQECRGGRCEDVSTDPGCSPDDPCCGVECSVGYSCSEGSCVLDGCDPSDPCCDSSDLCCGNPDPCCGVDDPCCGGWC